MRLHIGLLITILVITASVIATGCTGQLPGSFRYAQQQQSFNSQLQINTKIDLLWVVDNSSSMDVSQDKLRKGFTSFANKYMQPTWDIRVAVITTDTYLAHANFDTYLNGVVPGTPAPWQSPYMQSKSRPVTNPLYNTATFTFPSGVQFNEMVPVWGLNYAKLLPGLHDGPIPSICFEGMPYFLNGLSNCAIRDDGPNSGPSHCLNPSTGEDSVSQCVNTIENNTIHSGRAIIATLAPDNVLSNPAAKAAWTQQLADDFMINITTGSVGYGSERGLGSVLQMLNDNESSPTAFFRPGALRGIIFVSDEEDQTLATPSTPPPGYSPWTNYKCDQASLAAMNPTNPALTAPGGFCCAGGSCRFGSEGTSCAPKTIDSVTYTVSVCPRPELLVPVADVKNQLDAFFLALDGAGATSPNYFVASIVPLTGAAITSLQASRDADDIAVGTFKMIAVDRGDRYLALGSLVGNGSMSMNIADPDYSPILDAIGASIIQKKGTFTLEKAPTGAEDMIVKIIHADGSSTPILSSQYVVSGKILTITDANLVLSFKSTDSIFVDYQPKSLN